MDKQYVDHWLRSFTIYHQIDEKKNKVKQTLSSNVCLKIKETMESDKNKVKIKVWVVIFPLPSSKSDLGAELGHNTYTIVVNLTFDMYNHSLYLSILLFFFANFVFHSAMLIYYFPSFFLTISFFLMLLNIIKLQLSHMFLSSQTIHSSHV